MVCRWFHYSCAPASSCIDVGSGSWFHCDGCSSLHGLLGQAALSSAEARAASAAAPGGGDKAAVSGAMSGAVSLVLLDLGEIRRAREGEWDGTPEAGAAMRLRDPSALFKTCPRLLQKRQQQQQLGADAGERRGRERLLLCGAAAQRDLAAVARIFSRLVPRDPGDSALEEVGRWGRGHPVVPAHAALPNTRYPHSLPPLPTALAICPSYLPLQLLEADYALLARDVTSGKPVAAASLLVFGPDAASGEIS